MIVNLNVRVLGNGAILVQYQEDGKAKDAAFPNWADFITWLTEATIKPISSVLPTNLPK